MGYTQTRKNEGTEIARVTRCASGSLEGKAKEKKETLNEVTTAY